MKGNPLSYKMNKTIFYAVNWAILKYPDSVEDALSYIRDDNPYMQRNKKLVWDKLSVYMVRSLHPKSLHRYW